MMSTWVPTAVAYLLENALGAALLACVAFVLGRCCPQPRLLRAVWLLVLAKLVCPPLLLVPLPAVERLASLALVASGAPADAGGALSSGVSLGQWALSTWVVGAVTLYLMAWWGARRFGHVLRAGRSAPAWLAHEADDVAQQLGLARAPRLVLVDARLSPCLYGLGSGLRLVLPEGLLTRLPPAERRMILGHELVHVLHRDPWVRLFECLVTGLFWWHPVLWLARGQLRRWEERERDAQLLACCPEGRRPYARALLATVDYLGEDARQPALATRLFERRDFSERFAAVLQGGGKPRRRRSALLAMVLLWCLGPMAPGQPSSEPLGLDFVGGAEVTAAFSDSAWTVSAHDRAGTFELSFDASQRVRDVALDGQPLAVSRWVQRPGVLEILGSDGSVDFVVRVHENQRITWQARPSPDDS